MPTIAHKTVTRDADKKVFTSGHGQVHHGKTCTVVRAVTEEDKEWDREIGKTWVRLEDGTEVAVLNDEVVH
jgi:hypothetical protein